MKNVYWLASLFFATLALQHKHDRYKIDNRAFALAVDELKPVGNVVTRDVFVCENITGRWCQTFNEMVNVGLNATYVSFLSPEYTHFVLNISPRAASVILRRLGVSGDELDASRDLVEAYLKHTNA